MARAIEKGATYLDKLCHKLYDEPKGRGKKTDYVCRLCGGPLETYYCEERLYLVKCADCGTLALVKTVNPEASASVTLAQPTLTPQNEALTIEQLRGMDGKPVWIKRLKGLSVCDIGWALMDTCTDRIRVWWPGSEVEDTPSEEDYGKTWAAYGHPSKEN